MINAGANFATIGSGYWATRWPLAGARSSVSTSARKRWRSATTAIGSGVSALMPRRSRPAPIEWSAGAGYVSDSDHRAGVYGRIGVLTRR